MMKSEGMRALCGWQCCLSTALCGRCFVLQSRRCRWCCVTLWTSSISLVWPHHHQHLHLLSGFGPSPCFVMPQKYVCVRNPVSLLSNEQKYYCHRGWMVRFGFMFPNVCFGCGVCHKTCWRFAHQMIYHKSVIVTGAGCALTPGCLMGQRHYYYTWPCEGISISPNIYIDPRAFISLMAYLHDGQNYNPESTGGLSLLYLWALYQCSQVTVHQSWWQI